MTAFADCPLPPGQVFVWHMAGPAPKPHPIGPSGNQLAHLRKVSAQRAAGVRSTRWGAVTVRIAESLDPQRLGEAFLRFVRRHDTLHSGFHVNSDEVTRLVVAPEELELLPEDLGWFPTTEKVLAHLKELFNSRTDPLEWPAYVFAAVAQGDSFTAVMAFDHTHVDLYSYAFAAREVAELYAGTFEDRPVASHLEFCAQEQRAADPDSLAEAVAMWSRFTGDCGGVLPSSGLDLGVPSGEVRPLLCQDLPFLAETEALAFERWCAGNGLFAGLLAACAIALGGERFSTIVPLQTRRSAARPAIGWYVNATPIQFAVDGELDRVAAAARVAMLSAYRHGQVPYDLVAEQLPASVRATERVSWISYVDFRSLPGAADVHILADSRSGNEVDFWFNRVHDGLRIYLRYPDTQVSIGNVQAHIDRVREVIERRC